MTDPLTKRQAEIDALVEKTRVEDVLLSEKRLLRLASLGADDPKTLTPDDLRQICSALVVYYHQLGIS